MTQVYPTFIFHVGNGAERPFLVCVPDMEIQMEEDSFSDAIEVARDAIGLAGISMEDKKEKLPLPSDVSVAIQKVHDSAAGIDLEKGILAFVDVDFSEYRKKAAGAAH